MTNEQPPPLPDQSPPPYPPPPPDGYGGLPQGIVADGTRVSPIPRQLRGWLTAIHLSALAGLVIPLGMIVAPLVLWLIKRHDDPIVDEQGAEAINFNISIGIYLFVGVLLSFMMIGIPVVIGAMVLWIVSIIIAALRAGDGQTYRYPLTIRLIQPARRDDAFAAGWRYPPR